MYKKTSYSRIELIVSFGAHCYRVDTFITNGRDKFIDMFPSVLVESMLDLVYDETTKQFLKFRWEKASENEVLAFIKSEIKPKKISMMVLVLLLEAYYNTKIRVYNKEKWNNFITQE